MAVIYKIQNILNFKMYIGSTKRPNKRWSEHKNELRKGRHHSPALQNAWNKYGSDNFFYHVLREVTEEEQYEVEQFYFDFYKPEYICNPIASKPPICTEGRDFYLVNPEGVEINGKHLKNFCKENNLNYTAFSTLINGRIKESNGWTTSMENHQLIKQFGQVYDGQFEPFDILDPKGNLHRVVNQTKFCKDNGLTQANLSKVKRGERVHCMGWHLPENKNIQVKRNCLPKRTKDIIKRYFQFIKYRSLSTKDKREARNKIANKFNVKNISIYDYIGDL